MRQTALITGATSGLGLALVREMLRSPDVDFILPVRNLERAQDLRELVGKDSERLSFVQMDLSNLARVRAAANSIDKAIDIVMLNAGVQSAERTIYTTDGIEQSFAVNHLAHFVLLKRIEHRMKRRAVVGWVGSGTHHPELAKTFGFTGAHYLAPELLVKGEFEGVEPNTRQASRDAYATSKGLNILTARHFARLNGDIRYFSFDPGLMPGTGLAREGNMALKIGWKYVLPIAAKFMSGTSTPPRSAGMLASLLLDSKDFSSGDYVEFTGHTLVPHMPSNEYVYSERLFEFSNSFV